MRLSLATNALLILRTFALPSENRGSGTVFLLLLKAARSTCSTPHQSFFISGITLRTMASAYGTWSGPMYVVLVVNFEALMLKNPLQAVAERMQSHYWNSSTGYYNTGNLWGDAVRPYSKRC